MTQPFKATFRHSDYTEDAPLKGSIDEVISLFHRIDWAAALGGHTKRETFPELIVEREANGDLLNLQFLGSGDLFQCATIITIPRPILGLDIWLTRDRWESDAVELSAGAVTGALMAFGDGDAKRLQALWMRAASLA